MSNEEEVGESIVEEPESNELTEIEKIKTRYKDTSEFLKNLDQYIAENFIVEGSTMLEWKKHFRIELPPADNISFLVIVEKAKEIFEKYQRAAYFRDKQTVQMNILKQSKLEKYHDAYNDARLENERKHGKQLAAKSCEVAAIVATKNLEDAINTQSVIRDFWVKTCETLVEMRKLIDQMGYALSADAKLNKDFIVKGE